jgi:iron complex outermembrane receptor protein
MLNHAARLRLVFGSSLIALAASAQAQTSPAPQAPSEIEAARAASDAAPAADAAPGAIPPAAADRGDDIVVTGSRVVRNGFQAPTPVTVVAVEDLVKAAPTNIPDALNQLPQFSGSRGATGGAGDNTLSNANQPRAGNYLNLRNVGSQRMLVLLDGRRVPPTSFEGIVDTNTIPQALIQRVDVVTAGASAVYGADAVSGVVNFVLNTKLEGVRGTLQRGITERGDNANWRASIAGGTSFAEDRGHIVASFDHFDSDGIARKDARPYLTEPYYWLAGTGTAADPFRTVTNAVSSNSTYGGLITGVQNAAGANNPAGSGLLNTMFVGPQTTRRQQLGTATNNVNVRIGGDGNQGYYDTVLAAALRTEQAFVHARYDLTDNITAFAQGSYSFARNQYNALYDNRAGATALRIYSGNAFLPANIQAQMTATGTSSFSLSKVFTDLPVYATDTKTESWTTTAGFEGKFDFLTNGRWDVFYTHGDAQLRTSQAQNENRNLFAAIDAVRDPASGNVVCRVTLVNPGLLPGCVPLNPFGSGTLSAAASDYVSNPSQFQVTNKLDEVGANFGGSPFDTWAGPVAFNVGLNYRKQSLGQTSNADPTVAIDYTGIRGLPATTPARFSFTNVGVADGKLTSKEAYGELVVPILKDFVLAQELELNGAVRYTDYSTSGGVWTWKGGVSWVVTNGLRFRGTRSKDIRAPTLYDLFAGRQVNPAFYNDEGVTGLTLPTVQTSGGNALLVPEVGHTTAVGVVLQPAFLPGFSASIDYYDLKITNAISTITPLVAQRACVASGGSDPLCSLIIRPGPITDTSAGNFPTEYRNFPVNIASLRTSGVDFDVNYRTNVPGGRLLLRGVVSYLDKFETNSGAGARTFDIAATVNRSRWRATLSANLDAGPIGLFLQSRIIGAAHSDTAANVGQIYVDNDIPAQAYFDATINANIKAGSRTLTPFLTVNNLLDRKALIIPAAFSPGVLLPTDSGAYDTIGRRFTAGVRFGF